MLREFVHYGIHFLVPFLIALCFPIERRRTVILIFLGAMVIDIDHLLADPIFDPNRCSIGFHPLHSYVAITGYALLALFRKTRLFGLALLLHIVADFFDCLWL
ncbi:DUF6122 family protein [Flagellimonas sp. DF-77]|uniref:DUF6122 family protein n=1 Tax=Flagellimonas algarum TaxID=3230298 RepID=UPI0033962D6F